MVSCRPAVGLIPIPDPFRIRVDVTRRAAAPRRSTTAPARPRGGAMAPFAVRALPQRVTIRHSSFRSSRNLHSTTGSYSCSSPSFRSLMHHRSASYRRRRGAGSARTSCRFTPRLVPLEVRALLSTLTVTNDNDSGAGSLRDAIAAPVGRNDPVRPQRLRDYHADQRPARCRHRRGHRRAGGQSRRHQRKQRVHHLRCPGRRDGHHLGAHHHQGPVRRPLRLRRRRHRELRHADALRLRRHRQRHRDQYPVLWRRDLQLSGYADDQQFHALRQHGQLRRGHQQLRAADGQGQHHLGQLGQRGTRGWRHRLLRRCDARQQRRQRQRGGWHRHLRE